MSTTEKKVNETAENPAGTLDPLAFIVPRLDGLMDVLENAGLASDLELINGEVPYLVATEPDGALTYYTYTPVDLYGEGQFVLQMSRSVTGNGKDTETSVLDVASYNLGSEFGFAVQDPLTGEIVLRAQVPELGGLDPSFYTYAKKLFDAAYADLADLLSESDED